MENNMCNSRFISAVLLLLYVTASVPAQEKLQPDSELTKKILQLEKSLEETRSSDEKMIMKLESRLQKLEKAKVDEQRESELQKLLNEAQILKGKKKSEKISIDRVFRGSERHQPQLNPEISVTGDFYGAYTSNDAPYTTDPGAFADDINRFYLRDVGFHFMAPLDPFTRGKFLLGIPGDGDVSLSEMIDEAYMEWLNLPGGMNLKIGKFFNRFGVLNRYHDHGLPQFDRPRALTNFFGNGNLGGFGLSGNFLLPKLWAHANELDIEITTSGDSFCFNDNYDNVIGLVHFKNYYDLTRNTYLELGLSGARGYNDKDNEYATTLAGIDLTCKWVPAGRSHYRTTEFRSEFLMSRRNQASGDIDRYGFYSYIKNKIGARYWVGLRYSYSDSPRNPFTDKHLILKDEYEWDLSPTIDFWQSEFVMYRLQYSYTDRSYADHDHTVYVHTVWAMGPHKHEAY